MNIQKETLTTGVPIPNQVSLRFLLALIACVAVLNLINVMVDKPIWPLTRHIDMGSDTNMVAWFSSVLLALGGYTALQCVEKAKILSLKPWGFYLLSLFIFAMSCDEIARLHETIYGDLAKLSGIAGLSFAKHAAWVWVGGPVIALTFVAIVLVVHKQLILVPGTLIRLAMGLGLMFLGGVVLETSINFLNQQELKLVWEIEIIVEESLEMIGSLVIVSALLRWRDTPLTAQA
jgi:hypothetical protein